MLTVFLVVAAQYIIIIIHYPFIYFSQHCYTCVLNNVILSASIDVLYQLVDWCQSLSCSAVNWWFVLCMSEPEQSLLFISLSRLLLSVKCVAWQTCYSSYLPEVIISNSEIFLTALPVIMENFLCVTNCSWSLHVQNGSLCCCRAVGWKEVALAS